MKAAYQVLGKRLETLWKQCKLETTQLEEYWLLTHDVLVHKRNLDAVKEHEAAFTQAQVMEAKERRLKGSPVVHRSLLSFLWLRTGRPASMATGSDVLTCLPVLGVSHTGKHGVGQVPLQAAVGA